ncbi:MAG: hypothetical protein HZA54_06450 [Planctomycetes bacterium]|nr:hypothetical protein [Planctomycetota bacterium]
MQKKNLLRDENAQSVVEYALVTGFAVIGLIGTIEFVVVGDNEMRLVQSALAPMYRFASTLVALPIP